MITNNEFDLLRDKNILAILDGDKDFGEYEADSFAGKIKISMPYLSGPDLCGISTRFGLPVTYGWNGGAQSRWAYLDDLLSYCIENDKVSTLLSFLMSKEQFEDKLKGHTPETIDLAYNKIIETVMSQINGLLYFGGHELKKIGNIFVLSKLGESITVAAPTVKTINRAYIKDLSDRALKDIDEANYDSAITKSRTLLEEVFCHAIEAKGEVPSDSGDIGRLYGQVKSLYHMHQDKDIDKRINMLLSGLEKILSAIAQMRNESSDAHGVGERRINISEHHARLFVNSATTMADFILSVEIKALADT